MPVTSVSHAQRAPRVQGIDFGPVAGKQQAPATGRCQEAAELPVVQSVIVTQRRPAYRVVDHLRSAAAVGADLPARDLIRTEVGNRKRLTWRQARDQLGQLS